MININEAFSELTKVFNTLEEQNKVIVSLKEENKTLLELVEQYKRIFEKKKLLDEKQKEFLNLQREQEEIKTNENKDDKYNIKKYNDNINGVFTENEDYFDKENGNLVKSKSKTTTNHYINEKGEEVIQYLDDKGNVTKTEISKKKSYIKQYKNII